DLADIQGEMDRFFDGFFCGAVASGTPDRVWAPPVDMYETKDELVVTVEVPGLSEKDVHLSITGEVLTIRGERRQGREVKEENLYRGERWFGRFERTLPLPIPVQPDKVTATYRDGVLNVKLPKTEDIKPKEIRIDVL
ncbi:MAG: Hsp20/alpha crystallin family protein, partial [Candidatus Rokubacteria bacterium]|nr:Hsp20/alpha crystallin family protein [Candidatus Rokubacteria bacterium]